MLKKLAAISLAVGALVLAAPAGASAATPDGVLLTSDSYADGPDVRLSKAVVDICEVSTITFGDGYFRSAETVPVSISGVDAADATYSGNVANADGGLMLSFRPPADGEGTYAVAFHGSRSYTAYIAVSGGRDSAASCDHDPGVAPAGLELPLTGAGPASGLELALTGGGASPWVLGGAAVALAAGGVLVAVGITRRRRA